MVHGPCGVVNPQCPCMVDGQCSKAYPKPYTPETQVNVNGYPLYRRREVREEESAPRTVKDGRQDCRDIVPYNPRLLLRFRCHINVEVCTSIRAVKYLYKYTYKGPDRASIQYCRDEIQDYLDTRWVGPPEAMWRLLEQPPTESRTRSFACLFICPIKSCWSFKPVKRSLQSSEATPDRACWKRGLLWREVRLFLEKRTWTTLGIMRCLRNTCAHTTR